MGRYQPRKWNDLAPFRNMGPKIKTHIDWLLLAANRSILGYPTGTLKGKGNLYQNSMCHVGEQQSFNCPETKKQRRPVLILYTQHRIRSAKSTAYLKSYIFSHVLSNEGKRSQLCLETSRENLPLDISGLLPCRASFRKTLDKMMCLRVFAITWSRLADRWGKITKNSDVPPFITMISGWVNNT